MSLSQTISDWVTRLTFEDLPADVVEATKLRILDVIGLSIAGAQTPYGQSVSQATTALYAQGECRVFGTGARTTAIGAAFANAALSQALEFDDTHNESIVHMSSPAVAAALALADTRKMSGPALIKAIALGNEISSRVGSVAPGQFHRRGFHPTGLFAPFGVTWLAASVLDLSAAQMVNAAGILGSCASGLLQCWVDGTQSKFLHSGWAAQNGISAATLAKAGTTGPAQIFEGRFGLFASHLQSTDVPANFSRLVDGLGATWDSRNASFKPFPAAHVIHPYIDAILRLRSQHHLVPEQIERIACPVAPYIVGIVCEPVDEKRRPRSDSHGRVSLQYTLAETLVLGRLAKDAYAPDSLRDSRILDLADRVDFVVDAAFPGPERFKGVVNIQLRNGEHLQATEEHNRGSAQNPMSLEDLRHKFHENVRGVLAPARAERLFDLVRGLENLGDASEITSFAVNEREYSSVP